MDSSRAQDEQDRRDHFLDDRHTRGAQALAFSEPYLRTGLCLLVGTKSDVQTIADTNRAGAPSW